MDSPRDFHEPSSTFDDPFSDAAPPDPGQSPTITPEISENSVSDPPGTPRPPPPPDHLHPPSALRRRRPSSKPYIRRRVSFDLDSCRNGRAEKTRCEALSEEPELEDLDSAVTSDLIGSEGERRREVSVDSSEATSVLKVREDGVAESVSLGGALEFVSGLVIKSVFFQINLLVSFFTFPFSLLRLAFSILVDPFGTIKKLINELKLKFWRVSRGLLEKINPSLYETFNRQQHGMGKYAVRIACGVFWAFSVCLVLFALLVCAFIAGNLLLEGAMTKPAQVTRELTFDYTKATPDAFVALGSCGRGGFSAAEENSRLVPPNHKLQVTIDLTLPESNYNLVLGVFQVKVEFLSAGGKVISSSSQPCMLRFKSSHIRLIQTFLKSISLLSGYSSESQVINVKMKGFTEGTEPTTCIRVVLEQRAEYRLGAGIPEIYFASFKLESELPLLKRMIWNWRRTLFIWLSAMLFIFELLVFLVCLKPAIVPAGRSQRISSSTT